MDKDFQKAFDEMVGVRDEGVEFIKRMKRNGTRLTKEDGSDGTPELIAMAQRAVDRMNICIEALERAMGDQGSK